MKNTFLPLRKIFHGKEILFFNSVSGFLFHDRRDIWSSVLRANQINSENGKNKANSPAATFKAFQWNPAERKGKSETVQSDWKSGGFNLRLWESWIWPLERVLVCWFSGISKKGKLLSSNLLFTIEVNQSINQYLIDWLVSLWTSTYYY